ncbi:hypothetical protein VSX61_09935 [Brenneria populi subsp. brevivirga]|uniref:hypothetical protein n=1 Tax=Brenneria populi TaxID=1505588 RepID=UPI002E176C1D|nr:hypothetical protein [Brenneria populi subsp. brevivirga]
MRAAGTDPVAYFRQLPQRFHSIHIKDFDTVEFSTALDAETIAHVVELGKGAVDYPTILLAAQSAGGRHYFVEHDPLNGIPTSMEAVTRELTHLRDILSRSS